jgi:hypothetical protein
MRESRRRDRSGSHRVKEDAQEEPATQIEEAEVSDHDDVEAGTEQVDAESVENKHH